MVIKMIEKAAFEMKEEIIELREQLHRMPELSFAEYKTTEFIRAKLEEYGVEHFSLLETGVIGIINGKENGKTVLLRADIDALPIEEKSGVAFQSEHKGCMHACGHDVHTACLLAAAKILNSRRDTFCGTIKLVFQPGEETDGGALPLIEKGILENPHVDAAFALHCEPLIDAGAVLIKDGSIMASPDDFELTVKGVGGHGSAPELCVDPIYILSLITAEYKQLVQKYIKSDNPCVVSVCTFNSGSCSNVIPDTATITGTCRSLDNETRSMAEYFLEKLARDITKQHNAEYSFKYNRLFPPLINNSEANKVVAAAAKSMNSVNNIIWGEKAAMAGDDFSYFAQAVPSSYFKLGVGNESLHYPIHSPKFNIDNNALPIGAAILAKCALIFLNS